jgi:hypothetical protein
VSADAWSRCIAAARHRLMGQGERHLSNGATPATNGPAGFGSRRSRQGRGASLPAGKLAHLHNPGPMPVVPLEGFARRTAPRVTIGGRFAGDKPVGREAVLCILLERRGRNEVGQIARYHTGAEPPRYIGGGV